MIDPANKKKVIEDSNDILKNNGIVVIFIEGTRTKTGKMQKAKTGAARLALDTMVPVVPVGLSGTYEFWGRHMIFPRYKRNIKIKIGKKIDLSEFYHKEVEKELLIKTTEKIAHSVKKLIYIKNNL
jgi:1-acyl-sn-glycerol-3-phosphate acyltransferase